MPELDPVLPAGGSYSGDTLENHALVANNYILEDVIIIVWGGHSLN